MQKIISLRIFYVFHQNILILHLKVHPNYDYKLIITKCSGRPVQSALPVELGSQTSKKKKKMLRRVSHILPLDVISATLKQIFDDDKRRYNSKTSTINPFARKNNTDSS